MYLTLKNGLVSWVVDRESKRLNERRKFPTPKLYVGGQSPLCCLSSQRFVLVIAISQFRGCRSRRRLKHFNECGICCDRCSGQTGNIVGRVLVGIN